MDEAEIQSRAEITLKPNKYFSQVSYPFLYQRRGILMMLRRPRMVLGDDVGLGKTLEAVITYSYLKSAFQETKAIVFTEKIALEQWKDEIEKLTTGITAEIVTAESHPIIGQRVGTLRQFKKDVIITTYSLAYDYSNYFAEGAGARFVVFADEPSYFKTTTTKLHDRMLNLCLKATRAYALTATIIENKLEEAFGIMRVVYPGLIPDRMYFEENFCIKRRRGRTSYITGYKELNRFRKEIEPGYYGRLQTDPEVKQDLPEVIETDVKIRLGEEQSEKLVEALDGILAMPDGTVQYHNILTALIRAQQIADDPSLLGFNFPSVKTDSLLETLRGALSGQKILIHSKMRTMIDKLEHTLKLAGYQVVRITGAETTEQRRIAADRFQQEKAVNLLLMTRAGLKGVNLQAGGHFIWYDLPWSWGHYKQGVGRIKRTGSQFKTVGSHRMLGILHHNVAFRLRSEEAIDHLNLRVLKKKVKLVQAITDREDTLEATQSDIMEVYSEIRASFRKAA